MMFPILLKFRAHSTLLATGNLKVPRGVVISAITLAELQYGAECSSEKKQNHNALVLLLEDIPAMPFDAPAASTYGIIRAATREKKRDALDKLIAAHAISLDAILVTNNERDFKDYPGLKLENWTESH